MTDLLDLHENPLACERLLELEQRLAALESSLGHHHEKADQSYYEAEQSLNVDEVLDESQPDGYNATPGPSFPQLIPLIETMQTYEVNSRRVRPLINYIPLKPMREVVARLVLLTSLIESSRLGERSKPKLASGSDAILERLVHQYYISHVRVELPCPQLRQPPNTSSPHRRNLKRKRTIIDEEQEDLDSPDFHGSKRPRYDSILTPSKQLLVDLCTLHSSEIGGQIDLLRVFQSLSRHGYEYECRDNIIYNHTRHFFTRHMVPPRLVEKLLDICSIHSSRINEAYAFRLLPEMDWRVIALRSYFDELPVASYGFSFSEVLDWYYSSPNMTPYWNQCRSKFLSRINRNHLDGSDEFIRHLKRYFSPIEEAEVSSDESSLKYLIIPNVHLAYLAHATTAGLSTSHLAKISSPSPARHIADTRLSMYPECLGLVNIDEGDITAYIEDVLDGHAEIVKVDQAPPFKAAASEEFSIFQSLLRFHGRQLPGLSRETIMEFIKAFKAKEGRYPSKEEYREHFFPDNAILEGEEAGSKAISVLESVCFPDTFGHYYPRGNITKAHLERAGQFLPTFTAQNFFNFIVTQHAGATIHDCIVHFAPVNEHEAKQLHSLANNSKECQTVQRMDEANVFIPNERPFLDFMLQNPTLTYELDPRRTPAVSNALALAYIAKGTKRSTKPQRTLRNPTWAFLRTRFKQRLITTKEPSGSINQLKAILCCTPRRPSLLSYTIPGGDQFKDTG